MGQVWGWGRCGGGTGVGVGQAWGWDRCGGGTGVGVGQVWGCHTYRGVTKVELHPNDVSIAISHHQDVTMTSASGVKVLSLMYRLYICNYITSTHHYDIIILASDESPKIKLS